MVLLRQSLVHTLEWTNLDRWLTRCQSYFTSRVFYLIALCLGKLSVLVFTRRIFSGNIYKEKVFFAVAYFFTGLYGIGGVLLSSAGCRPDQALALGINTVCNANVNSSIPNHIAGTDK